VTVVSHKSTFDANPGDLFNVHLDAANLARISPPFPRMRFEDAPAPTKEGDRQVMWLTAGPVRVHWVAHVVRIRQPGTSTPGYMEDRQESGPFREWRHQHQVFPEENGSVLKDVVSFRLLPGRAGRLMDRVFVAPGLKLMFMWRHWRTHALLREGRHASDS
jgi:ligand-binding SRPBCC domain-containing protein